MQIEFKGKFRRDILNINNKQVKNAIRNAIENVEGASRLAQIKHLVKLKKYRSLYRIEIEGNYRIGIVIRKQNFICSCTASQ